MSMTRREFMELSSKVAFCSALMPIAARANTHATGCWIPPSETRDFFSRTEGAQIFQTGKESIIARSGDAVLDRTLARALAKISRSFGVLPAFAYYDDVQGDNAKATLGTLLGNTDGSVLMGTRLLRRLLGQPRPDAAIIAVCAHEFGHIVSYKNGSIRQLCPDAGQPFRAEQFADYMAGYFAGLQKLGSHDFPAAIFATTQRSFGGGDHGTGEQRGAAVQAGFGAAYHQHLNIADASAAGVTYAMAQSLKF